MVNILAVSDWELGSGRGLSIEKQINPKKYDVDIILNCGDLSPSYLEYLTCLYSPAEKIMVHGNHDMKYYPRINDGSEQHKKKGYYSEIYQGMMILNNGTYNLKKDDFSFLNENLMIAGFSGANAHGNKPFFFKEGQARQFAYALKIKNVPRRH